MDKTTEQIIQDAVANLLRVARRHKVLVAGFAFRFDTEAVCINFGTCTDANEPELYKLLCEFAERQRAAGRSQEINVGEVQ